MRGLRARILIDEKPSLKLDHDFSGKILTAKQETPTWISTASTVGLSEALTFGSPCHSIPHHSFRIEGFAQVTPNNVWRGSSDPRRRCQCELAQVSPRAPPRRPLRSPGTLECLGYSLIGPALRVGYATQLSTDAAVHTEFELPLIFPKILSPRLTSTVQRRLGDGLRYLRQSSRKSSGPFTMKASIGPQLTLSSRPPCSEPAYLAGLALIAPKLEASVSGCRLKRVGFAMTPTLP